MKWTSERWSTRPGCRLRRPSANPDDGWRSRNAAAQRCSRRVAESSTWVERSTFGILLALYLLLASAKAAGPLTAEIKPLSVQPRMFAPEAIDVTLSWSGSGLLEGTLELSSPDEDEGRPPYRTHDLALAAGQKNFRLLLPAAGTEGIGTAREIRARFLAKSGVIDLGRFGLGLPRGPQRRFTVCVGRPRFGAAVAASLVWQSLRLERFQPEENDYDLPKANTLPTYIDPEEMPATPLGYTPYDIVLLEGPAFTQMREKPLAALAHWVLAGGSLCVLASGISEETQRRFLTELVAADPRGLHLDFDGEGHPQFAERDGPLFVRAGYGRLVVASSPQNDAEANAERWNRAVAFLWKLPQTLVESVVKTGHWTGIADRQNRWEREQRDRAFAELLAPRNVRLLPYSIMLLILGAFVVVIGPVDWLVLGRFRLRRFTWITFPLSALAFSGLTVFLAGRSLGTLNRRSSLTITDLGHDGRVLRETRIELIFPARAQEVKTEIHSALCAPMSIARYGNGSSGLVVSRYDGLFPTSYSLCQSLAQWTPQMNRFTSIESGEDRSGVVWEKLHPAQLGAKNWREKISAEWDVYRVDRGNFSTLFNESLPKDFAAALSLPPAFGWAAVCGSFSPNGNGELNDLTLGGIDDADLFVTIIARRVGANFEIYRHLYAP